MINKMIENFRYTIQAEEFAMPYEKCEEILALLKEDGSFSDYDYTDQQPSEWVIQRHFGRLIDMASNKAFLQNNVDRFLASIDFLLAGNFTNPNWWHNDIGMPMYFGILSMCLYEHLTESQKEGIKKYLSFGSIYDRRETLGRWFGANLLWGVKTTVCQALFLGNTEILDFAVAQVVRDMKISTGETEEGIRFDNSFYQHRTIFYTGGYGRSYAGEVSQLLYILNGTPHQIDREHLEIFTNYLLDGMRYCTRNDCFDFMTVGRQFVRTDDFRNSGLEKIVLFTSKVEDIPRKEELGAYLKAVRGDDEFSGNKFFPEVNYYSAHSEYIHIASRVNSEKYLLGESINGENHLSLNLHAGGQYCVMANGGEYDNIVSVLDYCHFPGTTAPIESEEELYGKRGLFHGIGGKNEYSGGVSNGSIGHIYQDLNYNGVTGAVSRFFFGDTMVALGAGICCDEQKTLTTTLDQHLDDKPLVVSEDKTVVISGDVAYISLCDKELVVEQKIQTGNWQRNNLAASPEEISKSVTTLYYDHGIAPKDESYAFAIVPAKKYDYSIDKLLELKSKIEIVSNTDRLQCVKIGKEAQAVFHKNGSIKICDKEIFSSARSGLIL